MYFPRTDDPVGCSPEEGTLEDGTWRGPGSLLDLVALARLLASP